MDQDQLVKEMQESGVLTSPRLLQAFKAVDRSDFVLPANRNYAYENRPLHIGHAQTISEPTTVAFMLELLNVEQGQNVLDIGSGSGWTTALLAKLTGESGSVLGLEIVPDLAELGQKNIARYRLPHARIEAAVRNVLGKPSAGPYDRILVSASAPSFPAALTQQLKPGGVIVMPVEHALWKITKSANDELSIEKHEGFIFVPLT